MVRFVPRQMSSLWNDLRYSARLLIKTPAFTTVAVATLALGIGANAAIFSVVNAALINPLPYPDSGRLVVVSTTVQRDTLELRSFSYPDYQDIRDRQSSFDAIAAWSSNAWTLSFPDAPARQIRGELASAGYLEMLGATPIAGRTFTRAEDEARDAHPVVLVSHGFWQRDLGGGADAIGRSLTINDRKFAVIGVLPAGFAGLDGGADLWVPMGMLSISASPRIFDNRGSRWHGVVARLKPGVSLQQAHADVVTIGRQLEQAHQDTNKAYGAAAFSLKEVTVGQLRPLLLTMLGAVGSVLLIACVNLANLMLARASTRQREIAIRAALGADRGRLARQFLAEGALLSVVGAAAGLLLAVWLVDGIVALAPVGLPNFVTPRLDGRVIGFVVAVTGGAALLLGLLPAWQGSRADVNHVLKDSGRGTAGGARARTRSALVVAEVALSLLLLVGAGLMVRSFLNLQRVDVGFRADQAMTLRFTLPQKYKAEQIPQITSDLLARVSALQGVRHAAIGSDAPLAGGASATIVMPEGVDAGSTDVGIRIYRHGVTPGFFATLGAGLIGGRDFDTRDVGSAPQVAVVSRRFATKAWGSADPIGRRFTIGRNRAAQPAWVTVVGVVPDLRYRSITVDQMRNPEDPDIYFPFAQRPDRTLSLLVSGHDRPAALIPSVREAVHTFDRDIPTVGESSFADLVAARTAPFRLTAGVMSFFGLVALLLAAIGVYGLINYSVTQRRQELGVRVALGAGRSEIYRLVLKDALTLIVAGLVIGLAAALPGARLISTQLYGVTPSDPLTYGAIMTLLLLVGIAATLLPARRAARVDPIVALRAE
jgi:putative ABC transport system permease protein